MPASAAKAWLENERVKRQALSHRAVKGGAGAKSLTAAHNSNSPRVIPLSWPCPAREPALPAQTQSMPAASRTLMTLNSRCSLETSKMCFQSCTRSCRIARMLVGRLCILMCLCLDQLAQHPDGSAPWPGTSPPKCDPEARAPVIADTHPEHVYTMHLGYPARRFLIRS